MGASKKLAAAQAAKLAAVPGLRLDNEVFQAIREAGDSVASCFIRDNVSEDTLDAVQEDLIALVQRLKQQQTKEGQVLCMFVIGALDALGFEDFDTLD